MELETRGCIIDGNWAFAFPHCSHNSARILDPTRYVLALITKGIKVEVIGIETRLDPAHSCQTQIFICIQISSFLQSLSV
jgi:hypothetical protein